MRYVLKQWYVAGLIVCTEHGFDFCRAWDINGVSAEEAAAALVEHECSDDTHFCAKEIVKIVHRQILCRDGGVECDASAS